MTWQRILIDLTYQFQAPLQLYVEQVSDNRYPCLLSDTLSILQTDFNGLAWGQLECPRSIMVAGTEGLLHSSSERKRGSDHKEVFFRGNVCILR